MCWQLLTASPRTATTPMGAHFIFWSGTTTLRQATTASTRSCITSRRCDATKTLIGRALITTSPYCAPPRISSGPELSDPHACHSASCTCNSYVTIYHLCCTWSAFLHLYTFLHSTPLITSPPKEHSCKPMLKISYSTLAVTRAEREVVNELNRNRLFCSGNTFDNQIVEIAGWGTTAFGGSSSNQPARLQKTTVTTLSNAACKSMEDSPSFAAHVTEAILCTYSATGQDACQMDSGGGLFWRNQDRSARGDGRLYLVGVISYGRQCGRSTPGFNTRITNYLNWIIANSRGANFCIPGWVVCLKFQRQRRLSRMRDRWTMFRSLFIATYWGLW